MREWFLAIFPSCLQFNDPRQTAKQPSQLQPTTCPHFCLPNFCFAKWASIRQLHAKMGPTCQDRPQLGTQSYPCTEHYLVLNLVTECVSPQYHCRFGDFFETTQHCGPDISLSTICRQQLAGLTCTDWILSELAQPTQRSMVSNKMPPEMPVPSDGISASTFDHDITADEPQVITLAEGASSAEPAAVSTGTSCSGRVRFMSRRMVKSASQQDFCWHHWNALHGTGIH